MQSRAVRVAASCPVTILTGGAGTGKTHTTSVLVRMISKVMGMVLGAPTGKAAVTLENYVGDPFKAHTMHKILFSKKMSEHGRALILDEQSMCDPKVLHGILSKHSFTKLVFIGDPHQLKSVSPGQFLQDIIDSNTFPHVVLEKIYRTGPGSTIAFNAKSIRHGNPDGIDWGTNDFRRVALDPAHAALQKRWGKRQEFREKLSQLVTQQASLVAREGMTLGSGVNDHHYPQIVVDTNSLASEVNRSMRDIIHPLRKASGGLRADAGVREHQRRGQS